MASTNARAVYQLNEGDALRFGPPMAGEARVKLSAVQGGTLTLVTLTLQPNARIPKHRHHARELIWCVQKGQGRAIIDAQSATVVPGAVIRVAKGQWFSLRNTGTGSLVVHGVADQPGFEQFLQAVALHAGETLMPDRVQEAASQAGIEWLVDEGGRSASPALPPRPEAVPALATEKQPAGPRGRGRRRRRGHRGGRKVRAAQAGAAPTPAAASTPAPAAPAPVSAAPAPAVPAPTAEKRPRPGARPPKRGGRTGFRPRHERFKEVYMNGRWVKVSGEGPVIAGE